MEQEKCSSISEEGNNLNHCEDFPVTYCPKCKTFYVLDSEGIRTQITFSQNQY